MKHLLGIGNHRRKPGGKLGVCTLCGIVISGAFYLLFLLNQPEVSEPAGEQITVKGAGEDPAGQHPAGEGVTHAAGCDCGQPHHGGKSEAKKYPARTFAIPVASGAASVKASKPGARLELNFGDELKLQARVTGKKDFPGQRQSTSMKLIGRDGHVYWLEDADGSVMGNVILKEDGKNQVFKFNGSEGDWTIQQIAFQEYICASGETDQSVGIPTSDAPFTPAGTSAIVPLLNSLPGAEAVVYIDFDGEVVTGTRWVNGGTINAEESGHTEEEIRQIWAEVAEDMRPFEINVTTDRAVFDAARQNKKMMCIVTPTNDAAPGTGGVAYLNSFYDGSIGPCWCFNLGLRSAAMTVSHEIGHTFGLLHDGLGSQEYHPGNGTWGPIMGAPFGDEVVTWSIGDYQDNTNTENDLAIIDDRSAPYRADDYGNTAGTAFDLAGNVGEEAVSVTGIIETSSDVDVFSFKTSGGDVSLSATPTSAYPNMNISVQLYDGSGTLVTESDPADSYAASVDTTLEPGNYTFHVTGTGDGSPEVSGFTDYGSLGGYGLTGDVEGLGGLIVEITEPALEEISIAAGNGLFLAATVVGDADSTKWSISEAPFGGAATFTAPFSRATRVTFSQSGIYTVQFRASKQGLASDKIMRVSVEGPGAAKEFDNRGPVVSVLSPEEFYSQEGLLNGRALDDGVPAASPPVFEWRVVSGTARIPNPRASSPTIIFKDNQVNIVSLESSDGEIRTFQEIRARSLYEPRQVVNAGTAGRWRIPTDNSLGLSWISPEFDDSSWAQGNSGFGYANNNDFSLYLSSGTNLKSAMKGTSPSAYLRIPFSLPNLDYLQDLKLKMHYNDAFVVYLNGVEVARRNLSASSLTWKSTSLTSRSLADLHIPDEINLSAAIAHLTGGENILAIHGLNNSKGADRFLIHPVLQAGIIATPYLAFADRYGMDLQPEGNNDTDDMVNLVEHALGKNPLVADEFEPVTVGANGAINISLPEDMPEDIDYTLQKSPDMENWTAFASKKGTAAWAGESILVSVDNISNGRITYVVREVTALPSTYYRLAYELRGPANNP